MKKMKIGESRRRHSLFERKTPNLCQPLTCPSTFSPIPTFSILLCLVWKFNTLTTWCTKRYLQSFRPNPWNAEVGDWPTGVTPQLVSTPNLPFYFSPIFNFLNPSVLELKFLSHNHMVQKGLSTKFQIISMKTRSRTFTFTSLHKKHLAKKKFFGPPLWYRETKIEMTLIIRKVNDFV